MIFDGPQATPKLQPLFSTHHFAHCCSSKDQSVACERTMPMGRLQNFGIGNSARRLVRAQANSFGKSFSGTMGRDHGKRNVRDGEDALLVRMGQALGIVGRVGNYALTP